VVNFMTADEVRAWAHESTQMARKAQGIEGTKV